MQVIQKSIDDLKFRIPRPILEATFVKRVSSWRQTHNNIDKLIHDAVIRPRVFVDCNLVGGTETFIPLEKVPSERLNDYMTVFHISKDLTQGRSILNALNVTYRNPNFISGFGASQTQGNNTMLRAGQAVMDAMGSVPITSTANVQLIAENTILVRDVVILPANLYLRCILANDDTMSHIQPQSYRYFSKLVEYAVKAYIYNEMIVQMDMGQLVGGQALGVFKEIIDQYADANELYDNYLREVIEKVSFMNDKESYGRFLRMVIGGNR